VLVKLNPYLVAKQNLNHVDIARLIVLHAYKDWIFARARAGGNTPKLLKELRRIEFAMQAVWKFDRDESKHTWKYLMPNTPANLHRSSDWVKSYLGAMRRQTQLYYKGESI
jgi:hypothetical protein